MLAHLSIPSPPDSWKSFDLGTWIHSWLPAFPASWTLSIHTYAVCIIIGMIAAIGIAHARLTRRGGEPWVILDVAIWAIVLGIVVARAWHVVTHPADFFDGQNPWNLIAVWNGGIAIFGGLLGGALGVLIGCRLNGLRFVAVADAIAPALLVAQAIGRVGNYFNHELFGLPTDAWWGLEIESSNPAYPAGLPAGTLFAPTFLYELLLNLIGFVVLLVLERRFRLQWGKVLALYLVWYGLVRFWMESIRVDPSEYFLGIRSNVWGALAAIVIGVVLFIVQTRRHPGALPSVYRPGRQWVEATALDSSEFYSDQPDALVDDSEPELAATSSPQAGG